MDGMVIFVFLIGAVAAVIALVSRGAHLSGKSGERAVSRQLLNLPQATYHVLDDLVLPTVDGVTTQIDHVVISRYGIFVIETKDYDGWIFGGERQRQWTEVFQAGRHSSKKYQFQNPIRQNWRHIYVLAELLDLPIHYFHNVVVFCGVGKFKTSLPQNVMYRSGLTRYLLSFDRLLLSEANVRDMVAKLKMHRDAVPEAHRLNHVQSLISRHDPMSLSVACSKGALTCPRCGAQMVLRHRHSDGKSFYGCSKYPCCRGTVDA